ncbi:MAG TPA: peptidoglycan DD-metalloendopeptidase family protein [Sphingomicrobium sp.]
MRALASLTLPACLLVAASAPAQTQGEMLDAALRNARAEQSAAEAEAARLERIAAGQQDQAARLRARQEAAAKAVDAAEARITAADAELRLVSANLVTRRQRLANEQRPIASLLAGLAVMGQRPPLVAIADRESIDEFVKVRVLLDSTLPVIRRRTAALSAELREGERLRRAAGAARAELAQSRQDLVARRNRFAALERKAVQSAMASSGQALSAGDVALAAGEDIERLRGSEPGSRAAAALAAALAGEGPAPPRPVSPESAPPPAVLAYQLPSGAAVTDGLGSVNSSGVRSRGITLATRRGQPVAAPAAGVVRFSGPYRDYDGILIVDHGRGWMTLILNVSSPLRAGDRVRMGDPAGRALGPIGVELSQNGRQVSPALIAGSSQTLSKGMKGG